MRLLIATVVGCALALSACSHDFHLVDNDGGADAAPMDARIDGPPGPINLVSGGIGTETLHTSASGLHVFGGFSAGRAACPATGLCAQGGIHP
jgi:hypothetical protein